ncbi:fhkE [Symbiodinium microadriaticum]|nr:fhkE [Symbiodinium microadriaticum]
MMAPALKRRRICPEGFDPGATVPGGPDCCQAKEPGSINDENLVTEEEVRSRWDLRTLLGKGSFSEVRLGIRVAGGQRQAVKVVNRSGFESFQSSRRSRLNLVSEAKLLLSLDHPGVVKCSEWFQTTTSLYLVMELVEGGDLLKNIINNGEFCEDHARRLFRDISEAVAYLHSRDVVHRDLKPDNVLLTNEDRSRCAPKLADLGLAQLNARSTDSRTFCGTPHYFAPEVIRQWQSSASAVDDTPGYGKKVDIWSLGVLLYVVLSGSPPFEDEGLYEQILQGRYEFDAEEWGNISAEAKNLVGALPVASAFVAIATIAAAKEANVRLVVESSGSINPKLIRTHGDESDRGLPLCTGLQICNGRDASDCSAANNGDCGQKYCCSKGHPCYQCAGDGYDCKNSGACKNPNGHGI